MKQIVRNVMVLIVILLFCSSAIAATGGITADFTNTPITEGDYIWFSSSTHVMGMGNHPAKVYVRNAFIMFEADGVPYIIPVPDSEVTFEPNMGVATTSFVAGAWQVRAQPCCSSGNTFLSGVAFQVPAGGFPGGIRNVRWTADFTSNRAGVRLGWKWAAAVYGNFSTDYNALGVKPVDDDKEISPRDRDNAGTPGNFRSFVKAGARGSGGNNFTGNYSSVGNINLGVHQQPHIPLVAQPGGPYDGIAGEEIQFTAVGEAAWTYQWEFGDGTTGSGRSTSHTYQTEGTYTVILTVGNAQGQTASASTWAIITSPYIPPPPDYSHELEFSLPDEYGYVEVNAPAGSFEPGSWITIENDTTGDFITLIVNNDGSVYGELPAELDDTLTVTITNPAGEQKTWRTNRYVGQDGSVSIGPDGGVIAGSDGIELRIPQWALDRASVFRINSFGEDLFSDRPDFPEGNFGGGIELTAMPAATLKRDAGLAFPRPADAPDGSFYYVYRRVEDPVSGRIWFEAIDHAFEEGDKVVTASPPFPGVIGGVAANHYIMMWAYDAELARMATQGVITGHVYRVVPPREGGQDSTYEPISGAHVQLLDVNGIPWVGREAYSQNDGRFVFWDSSYIGDTRRIRATFGGEVVEATVHRTASPLWGDLSMHYMNIGYVTIRYVFLHSALK